MYLIDTNVVSELRKPRADANVLRWNGAVPAASLYLSAISVLELELGILRIERRDPAQGALLRRWLEHQVLPAFAARVLAIDQAVARRAAALHVPDPMPEADALIAATAMVHGLVLVTRNVPDFARCGVRMLDPWQA